jgi:phospho-N-acetylmuramoyl-pentapeptide-transferase
MLLELADLLSGWYRGFHLFQYLTFRAIMSTLTALTVSLLFGPLIIRKLADLKAGQVVRNDGPQSHLTKAGTPTMGGLLILFAVAVATLLWMDPAQPLCLGGARVTVAFGASAGSTITARSSRRIPAGLPARWKYFWQSLAGTRRLPSYLYMRRRRQPAEQPQLIVPFFKQVTHRARPAVRGARLLRDRRLRAMR